MIGDQVQAIFFLQQTFNQQSIDFADKLDTPRQILLIASSLTQRAPAFVFGTRSWDGFCSFGVARQACFVKFAEAMRS